MQDGRTRKITRAEDPDLDSRAFFESHDVALVTLSGTTAGNEYRLERPQVIVGRSPDSGLAFDDAAMSREHAAFELAGAGFRVRDLGSTNGVLVNGSASLAADLKHGDRVQIGEHTFQFILEKRSRKPRTYVLDD